MEIYNGDFCCEHRLKAEFSINRLHPYHVLYANYEHQMWEGYACVLSERIRIDANGDGVSHPHRRSGYIWDLYLVEGDHCSCYGLEGQWKPALTTLAALEMKKFYDITEAKEDIMEAARLQVANRGPA